MHFTHCCYVIVRVGSFFVYLCSIESQAPGTWEVVVVGLGRGTPRVAESTDRVASALSLRLCVSLYHAYFCPLGFAPPAPAPSLPSPHPASCPTMNVSRAERFPPPFQPPHCPPSWVLVCTAPLILSFVASFCSPDVLVTEVLAVCQRPAPGGRKRQKPGGKGLLSSL